MKILLIQPECQTGVIGFRLAAMPEPLALEILAASVPDHEVRILDLRGLFNQCSFLSIRLFELGDLRRQLVELFLKSRNLFGLLSLCAVHGNRRRHSHYDKRLLHGFYFSTFR